MPSYTHEQLEDMLDGATDNGVRAVGFVHVGDGRWMSRHQMILADASIPGTYWAVDYELPLTEMQEGTGPFEYQSDPVEAYEVVPQERIVIDWIKA